MNKPLFSRLTALLFPPKCVLCKRILKKEETDLCENCRKTTQEFSVVKRSIPHVARWTALWYYKDNVRKSILRFKFGRARHYAVTYGRLLGMQILKDFPEGFDLITWVPTGARRIRKRGYDHARLISNAVADELGYEATQLLQKVKETPPQSSMTTPEQRKKNIADAYSVIDHDLIKGKTILLLDDVITSGSSCAECSKTLRKAGAKTVFCAAIAAKSND